MLGVGLASRRVMRGHKKKIARSDVMLKAELEGFTTAHVIDLFGADSLFGGGAASHKSTKAQGKTAEGFSRACVEAMFKSLDVDQNGVITRNDLLEWSAESGADMTEDEINSFLILGEKASKDAKAHAVEASKPVLNNSTYIHSRYIRRKCQRRSI